MAIDTFDTKKFESALPAGRWSYAGMEDGERTYNVTPTIPDEVVKSWGGAIFAIRVRSSIGMSGLCDEAGKDSIRCVITKNGIPYGGKNRRWTDRRNGWARRMTDCLVSLRAQLLHIRPCPSCGSMLVPFTASKKTKNPDRPFVKCMNTECKAPLFEWADVDAVPQATTVQTPTNGPWCPDHKIPMERMGSGKGWKCSTPGNVWSKGGWTKCSHSCFNNETAKIAAYTPQASTIDRPTDADIDMEGEAEVLMMEQANAEGGPVKRPGIGLQEAKRIQRELLRDGSEATAIGLAVGKAEGIVPPVDSKGFKIDAPRPVKVKTLDPEAKRFVAALRDAASMLDSGAVDITPLLKESVKMIVGVGALAKMLDEAAD